jgi:putative transposase
MNETAIRATAGLAGLQPGSSSTSVSTSRFAGLQPGSAMKAKLELGEPSGDAADKGARLEPGEPNGELKWTDRGYMPHVDGAQLIQHVSYHLADSLPKEALEIMAAELKRLPPKLRDAEKEKRIAAYIDAGKGSCVLRVPAIAEMVQNAFLLFHGERYTLHAWCVMPNHVHVLFQPKAGWTMSKIVASWKSFTGRRISEYQKRAGLEPGEPSGKPNPIWHREYWDRYIRDHAHYANTVKYIHENPVKAGLVKKAEKWKWSSAYITAIE